jgi:hypothetical protein
MFAFESLGFVLQPAIPAIPCHLVSQRFLDRTKDDTEFAFRLGGVEVPPVSFAQDHARAGQADQHGPAGQPPIDFVDDGQRKGGNPPPRSGNAGRPFISGLSADS